MRKKLPSRRSLVAELKTCRSLNDVMRQQLASRAADIDKLQKALSSKIDDRMVAQRIELCRSIGQLVEAVSKTVVIVVGKETL